ncbi:transcription factor TFIID complex subunit Taf11 [Schizosaccharomyces japonicus yFS275]|uniref:Transcription initiation factor TFIID subunit 11 n=1 Tax=Schizosaccharomyces japonicus (strain yFS275 / FY16936) TaxID=402676 RepID=B6K3U4_SCHJY|nr:transcription factor TFIID complex subunit Taf11 [Schizosaccharomyces japonicus yFS275]EEB08151.1 transcription factor TFIID complex subunit Taf11 [Schizosaccharomyces japonicus yFS275]
MDPRSTLKRNYSGSVLQRSSSIERQGTPNLKLNRANTLSPAPTGTTPNGGRQGEEWQRNEAEEEEEDHDDFGTAAIPNLAGKVEGEDNEANEKIKTRYLLESFDETQMQRYEVFRRANLNKANVKKLANQILNQSVTPNVAIVISGFSKVFIGEIVELARKVQDDWGDSGPLAPDHLREAYRRYKHNRKLIPQSRRTARLLR